jgi:hypothetical protein
MANAWIIPPLALSGVTASTTALGAALYVANDYAGVVWQSASEAQPHLILDLGSDVAIDTLLLFGVELAPVGATVQVLASTQAAGAGFAAPTWTGTVQPLDAGATFPVSGKRVTLWSAPAGFPAAVRYLMVRFLGGPYAVRVARAVVGKRIQLQRNFSFGAAFGVRDLGSFDFSRRGVPLRTRGKKLRTLGLTFSNVRREEVELSTRPLLERIGNTEPIALVTDPDEHIDRQNRCYLGPLVGDLGHVWRNAAAFEARANVIGIF